MKIVPESMKVDEPITTVKREGDTVTSRITYPVPKPIDRADDEYEDDVQQEPYDH